MTQSNHPQTSEPKATQQPPKWNAHGAPGPLVVSEANPRYFTVASEATDRRVVYLTGSHLNNNFHDGMGFGADCPETPEQFDYRGYLALLKDHGHNFIRLWRWEQFKGFLLGANVHFCMTPQPWRRSGPGTAKDGKPKFDLDSFDQAYFDRLRDRVIAAGSEGIYISVMLFEGFSLHLTAPPDNVEGHPFHAANNINGIGITSINDYQVLPLDPRVQALQEAYMRKVIDTVHDLPNVLYEVANESSGGGSIDPQFAQALGLSEPPDWGDTTHWQYWVINFVKQYEREKRLNSHPIGMTMQFPVAEQTKVNDPLYNSPADWISPGYDDEIFTSGLVPMAPGAPPSRWYDNPPTNDGAKVVLSDTDHYSPFRSDALWAWKSFLRGHNPILYDLGILGGVKPSDPSSGSPSYDSLEPARLAMGDTLRYAERMRLVDMVPRGDLTSTGYALANPGEEYLVLQPSETADAFTVALEAGTYAVEWYGLISRETKEAGKVSVEIEGSTSFTSPFAEAGPVVLYLST